MMAKPLDKETLDCSVDENADSSAGKMRPSKITLPSTMEIDEATKLHKKLQKSAARGVDINLDAEKVETIDTAILQLLLSFVREVRGNGNSVNWQSPSEPLFKTAEMIGLGAELGLEESHATS
ncbi:MAG: hypothetical protein COA96_10625 [SAR86 cluster bacterium]|uniref:STAS domain-containing protein n=1 Tax=SAR86 cluster bacterium TaxID=2030880 RepID=A0A2A5AXA6_9GAMM|nr:MAG: hypothetical protein COA96_10625 [SAR86 cluster bacterium]